MGMLHARAATLSTVVLSFVAALAGLSGCGKTDRAGSQTKTSAAAAVATKPAPAPAAARGADEDPDKEEYIPAEFKSGADRWRDTGVYVDGKFVGVMNWAELPVALKPVWIKVEASAPMRYGTKDTGLRWAKERRYRFTDYMRAMGIDPTKVNTIHVYGPKFTQTIVAHRKDLMSKQADGFGFRFGGMVSGKPIPTVPEGFGNGVTPDKLSAVMIYIDKKAPVLERNVGLILDGELQEGVPYFGTPLRGGVRVYLDDRLVAYVKRQDLPVAPKNAGGEPEWKLFDYLRARGVNVDTVVEGWVVRQEKWQEKFQRADLDTMTFTASAQAKGHLELGAAKVKAQAIILRSHPVAMADVPAPDPEEL